MKLLEMEMQYMKLTFHWFGLTQNQTLHKKISENLKAQKQNPSKIKYIERKMGKIKRFYNLQEIQTDLTHI